MAYLKLGYRGKQVNTIGPEKESAQTGPSAILKDSILQKVSSLGQVITERRKDHVVDSVRLQTVGDWLR